MGVISYTTFSNSRSIDKDNSGAEEQQQHALVVDRLSPSEASNSRSNTNRTPTALTLAFIGFSVVILCGIVGIKMSVPRTTTPLMLKMTTPSPGGIGGGEVDGVRSCTFDECYASPCDAHTAPYTCLFHNGGPHGGCSSDEWTKETCDDQCNLSVCGAIPIPTDIDSCENKQCDSSWCQGGQICGDDVPYQCVVGSGRFGCSDDALHWTLFVGDQTCSECCDVTTC